jgi:hypothetical protein
MQNRHWGLTKGDPKLQEVRGILKDAGPVFESGASIIKLYAGNADIFGAGRLRRNGGGPIYNNNKIFTGRIVGEYFPLSPVSKTLDAEPLTPPPSYPRRLEVSDQFRGLLACGGGRPSDNPFVFNAKSNRVHHNLSFDPQAPTKPKPIFVNDDATPIFQEAVGAPDLIIDWSGYLFKSAS